MGSVIKKSSLPGKNPVVVAFEQMASRFDTYLNRQNTHKKGAIQERGMILFDKASTEQTIQTLARDFKYTGHAWGKTRCYAEVPVFLDSKASRLIQLADLVAYLDELAKLATRMACIFLLNPNNKKNIKKLEKFRPPKLEALIQKLQLPVPPKELLRVATQRPKRRPRP